MHAAIWPAENSRKLARALDEAAMIMMCSSASAELCRLLDYLIQAIWLDAQFERQTMLGVLGVSRAVVCHSVGDVQWLSVCIV